MPEDTAVAPKSAGNASSASKKRKRLPGTKSPNQHSITNLFSTSQQKPAIQPHVDEKVGNVAKSPPATRKRSRIDPNGASTDSPHPTDTMYTFASSRSPKAKNVVDLTGSSPGPLPLRKMNKTTLVGGQATAKRIEIKNRQQPKSDPQSYYDQMAKKLESALESILRNEKQLPSSNEELYRGVVNFCKQGREEELYGKLRGRMKQQALTIKDVLRKEVDSAPEAHVQLLRSVLEQWSIWKAQWAVIQSIFFFLDRTNRLNSSSPTLEDLRIQLFLRKVVEHKAIHDAVLNGSCKLVEQDRLDEDFDLETIKAAVSMCNELAIYTKDFEPLLLAQSQAFASEWATTKVASSSLPTYVQNVMDITSKEMDRCDAIGLSSSTRKSLLALLDHHLIEQQKESLVNVDSVADLLDDNLVDDLRKLYKILERCDICESLRPAFDRWIVDTGTQIVFDDKNEDQMVVKLLTLRRQLDHIWSTAFSRNQELMHGLRESFELFINKTKKSSATHGTDNSKPGEMIAKYVDLLLRGGSKAIPAALSKRDAKQTAEAEEEDNEVEDEDSQVNEQLGQVLDIFRFLHGKAVFEAFYKKDLARRLLMGRSASSDAEQSMLLRLKNECGSNFTSHLERMFKDMELSREEMAEYKARLAENDDAPGLDLSVNVLSASSWPSYPDVPVNIPSVVKSACDRFELSYHNHHQGRKLEWKHGLSHCQLVGRFPKGTKELVVSGFQAIVLLLFSKLGVQEQLSYEQIKAETGLPAPELHRTLQSLACAKLQPLRKTPRGRDINDGDMFSLNAAFTHERYRVKINQIQLKETKEENKETHERVAADRNFETQAAVVRIMKSKKTIKHELLIAEVIEATRKRGVLSVADIKGNIERLIEKEYMERIENNMYSYVS